MQLYRYAVYVFNALQFPPAHPMRKTLDGTVIWLLRIAAFLSILITGAIVLSVLFEAIRFFNLIPLPEFLLNLKWSPQSGKDFGALPLFWGTMFIMVIAMLVAVPIGLFAAIYLSEYANRTVRKYVKPALELLAGIPTVVYGYFAISSVSPFFRSIGKMFDLSVSAESALAAGVVMGVMIIPFISSLADDILTAVPQSLRDASSGLGATQAETISKVVLPAALPGIMGAVLLGVSRAIGETMIVVMAAGLMANITINPLESVTTVTAQIVALLTGDQEFDSAKTLAAFALGLTLFIVTLVLNIVALVTVKKYQEQYD